MDVPMISSQRQTALSQPINQMRRKSAMARTLRALEWGESTIVASQIGGMGQGYSHKR
jgi:hypothetical protein